MLQLNMKYCDVMTYLDSDNLCIRTPDPCPTTPGWSGTTVGEALDMTYWLGNNVGITEQALRIKVFFLALVAGQVKSSKKSIPPLFPCSPLSSLREDPILLRRRPYTFPTTNTSLLLSQPTFLLGLTLLHFSPSLLFSLRLSGP